MGGSQAQHAWQDILGEVVTRRANPSRSAPALRGTSATRRLITWPSEPSLADNEKILRRFTWTYIGVIPGAVILGSFLGWIMAGRALNAGVAIANRPANLKFEPQPPHSHSRCRRRTGLPDPHLQPHDRAPGSLFQQMKQFSADVSHELRTPITAIRGQLEVALFTAKTTDQYREAVQRVAGCRPPLPDRTRPPAAFAGRVGPTPPAEIPTEPLRSHGRPRRTVPDSCGRGTCQPDRRPAPRVSCGGRLCRSSA